MVGSSRCGISCHGIVVVETIGDLVIRGVVHVVPLGGDRVGDEVDRVVERPAVAGVGDEMLGDRRGCDEAEALGGPRPGTKGTGDDELGLI